MTSHLEQFLLWLNNSNMTWNDVCPNCRLVPDVLRFPIANTNLSRKQVNFYHDHTKIILCSQNDEYLLTYINEERVSTTLRLSALLRYGCSPDLRSRMEYALNMLLQRCN